MATTPWFIRARLRTRHLMLLVVIGEEGNIHKAAQLMNVSQPAASRLLSDLEDIIGVQLFERLPRGVRANAYGEALIRRAREALASLGEAASEIDLLKSGHSGHVTVGSTEVPAMGFVPKAIAKVVRRHTTLRVKLLVQTSEQLLEALKNGKLDLMVGSLPEGSATSGFEYERLAEEPACAVVRPGHPLLQRHDLDLHELADLPWIVPPLGTESRRCFDEMFLGIGLGCPRQVTEAVSTSMIVRLLEETDHLAVLSREVAEYYATRQLLAILPANLTCKADSFGVITRKGRPPSPSASLIYDAFATAAEELAADSAESRQQRALDPGSPRQPFAARMWKDLVRREPVS